MVRTFVRTKFLGVRDHGVFPERSQMLINGFLQVGGGVIQEDQGKCWLREEASLAQ